MRMSLLVVHTIVISYLTFDMYYFVSATIVYPQNFFVNPICFFSLNFTIFPISFCCICTIKIHYNTYSISKYLFFALINALIDAFINIIQLIPCIVLSYWNHKSLYFIFQYFFLFLLKKNKSAYTNSFKCIIIYVQKSI